MHFNINFTVWVICALCLLVCSACTCMRACVCVSAACRFNIINIIVWISSYLQRETRISTKKFTLYPRIFPLSPRPPTPLSYVNYLNPLETARARAWAPLVKRGGYLFTLDLEKRGTSLCLSFFCFCFRAWEREHARASPPFLFFYTRTQVGVITWVKRSGAAYRERINGQAVTQKFLLEWNRREAYSVLPSLSHYLSLLSKYYFGRLFTPCLNCIGGSIPRDRVDRNVDPTR